MKCNSSDPNGNSTTWQYNSADELVQQTNALGASDYYVYNGDGELVQKTDADGRATVYAYNAVGQETTENWYASVDTSGNPVGNPTVTLSFVYNAAGELASATDENFTAGTTAVDSYTYDMAGETTSETEQIPGLAPTVTLASQYTNGDRTQLAASIGSTNDFVNNYQYQGLLGEMSQVTQTSNGGNAVAAKTATFQYDLQGELTGVDRYQNADATANFVAQATYGYDAIGALTSLAYTDKYSNTLDSYTYSYDALGNMASSTNTFDGTVSYTSDATGQLSLPAARIHLSTRVMCMTPTAIARR